MDMFFGSYAGDLAIDLGTAKDVYKRQDCRLVFRFVEKPEDRAKWNPPFGN